MNSISVIELRKYSEQEICEKGLKTKDLNQLFKYSYVNYKNGYYTFTFVGIILINDILIECYPKYISNEDLDYQDFKEIVKVIRKYNRLKEEVGNEYIESDKHNNDLLSLMLFFLEDYYENGVYSTNKKIIELNGTGEINWEKTINNHYPIIQENYPYYVELETRYNQDDIYNYYRILHECIITECSKKLEELKLIELFDLTPVEISEKTLGDFEEVDILLDKLEKQFNMEFNIHKQKILKSMYAYISEKYNISDDNIIMVYGTSYYSQIWESVCQLALDNQLHVKLKNLHLINGLHEEYEHKKEKELIDLIDKPKWKIYEKDSDSEDNMDESEKKTLIPDLVTFYKKYFIIFDAKYYHLQYKNKVLSGNPGIGDITKQYFYEEAFKDFVNKHKTSFDGFQNGFLIPTENNNIENMGFVKLDFISDLEEIQIIKLPAKKMYKRYLNNEPCRDLSKFKLKVFNKN